MRPPIDLPPMKSGSPANASCARAAAIASRHDASRTGALSGTLRPFVMYGKSKVAVVTPRPARACAASTMNRLCCPAPAPCARTSPAAARSLR
jgi:hypothetical protein